MLTKIAPMAQSAALMIRSRLQSIGLSASWPACQ
jgi:hypothetical protein